MKLRIIVSLILIPIMLYVMLGLDPIVSVIVVAALCAIGTFELLYNTRLVDNFRLITYSMIMSFLVTFWGYYGSPYPMALGGIIVFFSLMFAEVLLSGGKISFDKICICFMAAIVMPYFLSSIGRIMAMEKCRNYILLPFAIAFSSDGGAYFIGIAFGKHKLAPVISPKKTVEGLVGGIICSVVATIIYSLVLQFAFHMTVNYFYAVVFGVVGSLAATFGDLCFSVIKRQTGIKDYGNLIPGHGGVLDRFDSVIMVGPLVELLLLMMPVAI